VDGIDNLFVDMSAFAGYNGFSYAWNSNTLTLSYSIGDVDPGGIPNATPEPATLLILGLGAVGAGFAARRRMKR